MDRLPKYYQSEKRSGKW